MALLGDDSTESVAETVQETREAVQGETPPKTSSTSFKLARLLFGGVLAFMAVDNFRNLEETVGYAESKGAPMAETTVPAVTGSLLFGGLGIAAWKLPRLAAGAVATFFLSITPVMHDFWAIDDEEQKQQQMIHFLKNLALLGGALAFLRIGEDD
ncbi:DoxX family protein [Halorussus sp. MSC15.2]|uniref:DoxX family protein n=1 Tax=Halorussus sp. MSC15.2 TaxID=2283638 RepID=UPI0013D7CA59|nr:DoxX family protein [Halorussus sp. MSC15.2]NEU57561.1 DoxX family protein [Halorussus sp. MSC15.2]